MREVMTRSAQTLYFPCTYYIFVDWEEQWLVAIQGKGKTNVFNLGKYALEKVIEVLIFTVFIPE